MGVLNQILQIWLDSFKIFDWILFNRRLNLGINHASIAKFSAL